MNKKLDYDYCPAAPVLEWCANKWALVVLWRLREGGVLRFNELYRTIPSISEKVLARTLDLLERDGLVTRAVYPEVPPRTEYRATALGDSLWPHLEGLRQWALEHGPLVLEHRRGAV